MPSAVIAAAVLLSLSSTADVTVAAVLMNAGRQIPARATADAESLGQWLSRFTDAARQMRDAFTGDDVSIIGHAHAALTISIEGVTAGEALTVLIDDVDHLPHAAPLRANLTDLPPPQR